MSIDKKIALTNKIIREPIYSNSFSRIFIVISTQRAWAFCKEIKPNPDNTVHNILVVEIYEDYELVIEEECRWKVEELKLPFCELMRKFTGCN